MVNKNPVFKQQQELLMSIPGVGMQTTCNLIAVTNAFTSFKDCRKLACYCGVAPLRPQSGTIIKKQNQSEPYCQQKDEVIA